MAGSHVFSVDAMSLPTSVQSPRRGWSKSKPMPIPFESGELMCFGAQAWLVGFTSLVLLHAVCYFLITWAPNKSGRITEMKRDPHLAAHALPQLLAFVYAAWLGVDGWLWHAPAADATTIASHVPGGERMACMMIGFQLYELSACVVAERLRGTRPNSYELLGHHATALLLAVLVYYAQAFQFYAPAFMGLPELSSLPLAFVDLFKHFPSLRKGVPAANELARNIFAVTFLAVRGCYWPYCSVAFWRSAFAAMADENAQLLARPIVHTFLVCNVLMTALQWYWASIILTAIVRLLRGDPRHKDM